MLGAPPSRALSLGTVAVLLVFDGVALAFIHCLAVDGQWIVAGAVVSVAVAFNGVFLCRRFYPVRWLAPGLLLMLVMVVYPAGYTAFNALTNTGDGHLLRKDQVVAQLEQQYFIPTSGTRFSWQAYRSPDGRYLLWLIDEHDNAFLAEPGVGVKPVQTGDPRFGPLEADGLPETVGEYVKLGRIESVKYLTELQELTVAAGEHTVRIVSLDEAQQAQQRYTYDARHDVMIDQQTGVIYTPIEGVFTSSDGQTLSPGFSAVVGLRNFARMLTDPQIRAPFVRVFIWTVAFAGLSVLLTFSLGLGLAMVLNDKDLPLKGLFRSLAIIPYTIPGFISALVWVGLLNPYYGPLNLTIQRLTGVSPQWFSDPTLAKVATLIVNTWLGYPYMLLVSLGALQSIPADLYEVAQIDGANRWQQFRAITLPLLLLSVGPLLIGCFAFNFNNFTVIDLVTEGGPPMVGGLTPAGHTDILISYTYRLAFAGGRGAEYGFASAISVVIFAIIAAITISNFRYTRALEGVSENV